MSVPWVESPFFWELLEKRNLPPWAKEMAVQFHENGFVVVDLNISQSQVNKMFTELAEEERVGMTSDQSKTYKFLEYRGTSRIFDAWRHNDEVLDLATNPLALKVLEMLYGKPPLPFQTINFFKGSRHPLHSDLIHVSSMPERWVSAVWVALEDMDTTNGAFMYVPGSHKLPFYDYDSLGIRVPKSVENRSSYALYEDFIKKLVKAHGLKSERFLGKRGQAIICAANILHGGSMVTDENRTRLSQVTHYYYPGCARYYCPMFSSSHRSQWALKDLTKKDILREQRTRIPRSVRSYPPYG